MCYVQHLAYITDNAERMKVIKKLLNAALLETYISFDHKCRIFFYNIIYHEKSRTDRSFCWTLIYLFAESCHYIFKYTLNLTLYSVNSVFQQSMSNSVFRLIDAALIGNVFDGFLIF